ncbi:MAG: hypothetical protein IPG93_01395 [Burkholderiales bacterium]|nr:hypothetical protein [Burkholderiales bacterium]
MALLAMTATALAGCVDLRPSTAVDPEHLVRGVAVLRSLPEALPAKSAPVPHAQIVLLPSESAAQLLVPVPFVGEAVEGAFHASAADSLGKRLASLDPYRQVLSALQASQVVKVTTSTAPGEMTLRPFVFMQDCADDRYRLTLVAHLQGGDWVGRYLVHLPTTYSQADYAQPTPQVLATMEREIGSGAVQLRQLVERGARGQLGPSGVRADVGSLHLVGVRAIGLMSPNIVRARDVDLIEEGPDHVIVRMRGDMTMATSAGGLFFGVHLLRKDQLHAFTKHGSAS